jgi:non-specific serine/threonine protein kinase
LELGLEIVGENVLLNAGMAEVYLQYYEFGYKTDKDTLGNAAKYTELVKKMQPDSAEGYYLSGRIERFQGTALKAVRHFEKAFTVNPKHTSNLLYLGGSYTLQVGQANQAEPFLNRLIEIDPLTPLSRFVLGLHQIMKGHVDLALTTFQNIYRMEPDNWFATLYIIVIFAWQKRYEEAYKLIDEMIQTGAHEHVAEWCLFFKFALRGQREKAFETLSDDVKKYFWNDPELPWLGACAYSLLDEREEAIHWLEQAVDRGWINYPLFSRDDPLLENIRGERRFQELMAKIKPEWERFEVRASLGDMS